MKKRKLTPLFISLAMCAGAFLSAPLVAADDNNAENKGMVLSKTATPNGNGTYKIQLEAYATGEEITSTVTKDIPTDIVLVLDQSGSMDDSMNVNEFRAYEGWRNQFLYEKRHNGGEGNLYYLLDDGSYVTVSVTKEEKETEEYTECPASWTNEKYYSNKDSLYANVNGEYIKIGVEQKFQILPLRTEYIYTGSEGWSFSSNYSSGVPGDFGGKGPLYLKSKANVYTYSYTTNGEYFEIGKSDGNNTVPETIFYEHLTSLTRLEALKDSVTSFSNAVAAKAAGEDGKAGTEDDVDHRIAMVGYAYGPSIFSSYENTELFIGSTEYKYGDNAKAQYGNAFQSMDTANGQQNIQRSIEALDANGPTYTQYGLEMANGIFGANPVNPNEKRNRVIILFTDGYPGQNNDDFDSNAAQAAIDYANAAKNTYGASVYTVGIFEGADATSAGNSEGDFTDRANWFMQKVSSNNGTPSNPSYYLSAADAGTLNNIFQQISDNIQTGGSSVDLGSEAVIKDVISDQFELPAGTVASSITLESYSYVGENKWEKNSDAQGATAAVSGNQVSVTGFNFKENWCGTETKNGTTTYRGNKLVISFDVKPKSGFLGGNGVYTNGNAGVFENESSESPLFTFEKPTADVQIPAVSVNAEDKNVYLMGGLTADQIKSGVTAKVGSVSLDLSKEDYGLEPWQTAYVDINVDITDKDGKPVTNLSELKEDTTYKAEVTVKPKTEGAAKSQSATANGHINVYKPEVTHKDNEVWYGAEYNADTDLKDVLVSTKWKHGSTEADHNKMGAAPELIVDYYPLLERNVINTKKDIPVAATVNMSVNDKKVDITEYTTLTHKKCDDRDDQLPQDAALLLHVNTCDLTITKTGGQDGEPYVFTILKDGQKYTEASVTGNSSVTLNELPVGTYSIAEDTGWSWRFTPIYSAETVSLNSAAHSNTITCTNTKGNNQWLNGYSGVKTNVHGDTSVQKGAWGN